jgi:hypothetical protein
MMTEAEVEFHRLPIIVRELVTSEDVPSEQIATRGNPSGLHSIGTRIESLPGHWLSLSKIILDFLNPSTQVPKQ